ncbi:DNA-directed RNA polymerase specialized sigma54-like protein [Mesorhizobium robiniae]|uniref:DNA-directed RNA polymerase specialized sigma54-like protein n=1 Tax=Mesorhizobium robiniae TaxID=559315 RepID=A0ABV2GNJ4_9HYPH
MTSIDKALDFELQEAIARQSDLNEAIEVLKKYKNAGVAAEQVYGFLNVKLEAQPENDDFIREIMDIVIGYCSPHVRVWD